MDRIDLFHLPFYKKEAFTGSDRGIRFWIGKVTVGEEEEAQDYLRVTVWPEPYAWKHTDVYKRQVPYLRNTGWTVLQGRCKADHYPCI